MIIYYELVDLDYYGEIYRSLGSFSTYEKAEEFKKNFEGLDGFGVCEDDIEILEQKLELDIIDDRVIELIENCKKRKQEYIQRQD